MASQQEIRLPDGRALAYSAFGAATGPVVVVLDGPGSRAMAQAAAPIATGLGLRLVAPDRPGFGASDPHPAATHADWAADHAALQDALGCERAGILAQSGGTPFAIAAATLIPDRVEAVSFLGAVAPLSDKANLATASRQLRGGAKLSRRAPWLLRMALRSAGTRAQKDPEKAARKVADDLVAADAKTLEDPEMWSLHVAATKEILGCPDALAGEIGLVARPWTVDPSAVKVPVAFWTGEFDDTHPISHARALAGAMGATAVTEVPAVAQIGLRVIYEDALRFAARL
jgi:pimeloyl-ACP methyl ester carboxylesterase